MQRADVKTVMHTTQCPYFQQLLGSKRNTHLSILLFSYLDGIFCISFALKLSLFFLGMLILSLTFRSFEFHPTMWFSASLSFDCHLQTPGQPLVSPGLGLGALAYERILAGSLAGWCQCALGLLQWSNQERRGKSASPCEVKALMLKCECFIQMWNGLRKC